MLIERTTKEEAMNRNNYVAAAANYISIKAAFQTARHHFRKGYINAAEFAAFQQALATAEQQMVAAA